jgi:hypothetical protein
MLRRTAVAVAVLLALRSALYLLGLWVIVSAAWTDGFAVLRPDWLLGYESWLILTLTAFQFSITAWFFLRLWKRITINVKNTIFK